METMPLLQKGCVESNVKRPAPGGTYFPVGNRQRLAMSPLKECPSVLLAVCRLLRFRSWPLDHVEPPCIAAPPTVVRRDSGGRSSSAREYVNRAH